MNVNNDDDGDDGNYNNLDRDSEQKNRRLAVPGREETHRQETRRRSPGGNGILARARSDSSGTTQRRSF